MCVCVCGFVVCYLNTLVISVRRRLLALTVHFLHIVAKSDITARWWQLATKTCTMGNPVIHFSFMHFSLKRAAVTLGIDSSENK